MFVCTCVGACTHGCRCPQRLEEYPEMGVTESCEPPREFWEPNSILDLNHRTISLVPPYSPLHTPLTSHREDRRGSRRTLKVSAKFLDPDMPEISCRPRWTNLHPVPAKSLSYAMEKVLVKGCGDKGDSSVWMFSSSRPWDSRWTCLSVEPTLRYHEGCSVAPESHHSVHMRPEGLEQFSR